MSRLIPSTAQTLTPVTNSAVILDQRLPTWRKLDVTAFLASTIVVKAVDSTGLDYADADGTDYAPMFGPPHPCGLGPQGNFEIETLCWGVWPMRSTQPRCGPTSP